MKIFRRWGSIKFLALQVVIYLYLTVIKSNIMKVAVWDTYVKREDGSIMHFDIMVSDAVTDEQTVFDYGKTYLKSKPFSTNTLSANECRLCHTEHASAEIIAAIEKNGYSILEMENCN